MLLNENVLPKWKFLIMFEYLRLFLSLYTECISRNSLKKSQTKWSVFLCLWFSDSFCEVFALTGWLDSRLWLCLPESGEHGVCPCSEVCVRPSEAGLWFQVARSQLAAFVWLKHSETLGVLKMQCHFRFLLKKSSVWCWLHHIPLMKHFYSDEIISYWWDHFV